MLTLDEGKILVTLARQTLAAKFSGEPTIIPNEARALNIKRGVFVTLTSDGALRGCIGFPEPLHPLFQAVMDAAKHAAFDDPRFPPLKHDELEEVKVEVSVLTKPERMLVESPDEYLKEIMVGRDGLIIKAGVFSGLLLPQVPVEYNWDVETFLRHLCMKAGMSYEAWQNTDHRIYRFQAQIFKETEDGSIIEETHNT